MISLKDFGKYSLTISAVVIVVIDDICLSKNSCSSLRTNPMAGISTYSSETILCALGSAFYNCETDYSASATYRGF